VTKKSLTNLPTEISSGRFGKRDAQEHSSAIAIDISLKRATERIDDYGLQDVSKMNEVSYLITQNTQEQR
jgi:hypothetical protein